MAFSEPWQVTQERRRKAAEMFPALGDTEAGTQLQIDNWVANGNGVPAPVSQFTQLATALGRHAAEESAPYDPNAPDAAPNVDLWEPRTTGMLEAGNIDLSNRPRVQNADGSMSTVRSISVDVDGKTYLIPTVVGNRVVSNDEAIRNFQQTGQHLGMFGDPQSADEYAQRLHDQQAAFYVPQLAQAYGEPTYDPSQPDPLLTRTPGLTPLQTYQQAQQGSLGFFTGNNLLDSLSRARRGLEGTETFSPYDLGFVRNLEEGDPLREPLARIEGQLVDPINLATMGQAGAAKSIAVGIGAEEGVRALARGFGASQDTQDLLGAGANIAGNIVGSAVVNRVAPRAATWMEAADNALADASGVTEAAIRQRAPEAFQIGRAPGTDELFTFATDGERIGPTGGVREIRLGREPQMGEDVNRGLRYTNLGRAEMEQLAAADQAAFQSAYERAIAGAERGIGGGADLTPDEFARLTAKKAAGETLTPDEQDSVLQALGRAMGASTREEQAAAREALYNGPVPTDMREVDTGILEGVRQRLGAPTGQTVEDALGRARAADVPPLGGGAPNPEDVFMTRAEREAMQPAEPFPMTGEERALRRSLGDTSIVSQRMQGADAIAQLRQRIEDAKPLEQVQDEARGALRRQQAGAFSGALQSGTGEAGMRRAIGAMRGQMERPTFEPLRQFLEQPQVDELTNAIIDSKLRPFEKAQSYEALTNILDGRVPTPSSLANLESVFPGVTDSLVKAKIMSPQRASVVENVADVLNLWRTVKTAWDVSAPFRQGLMLAGGHPREFFGAMPDMFKAFAKSGVAEAVDDVLRSSDNAGLWEDAGLYLAPLDGKIGQREEAFMSKLAGRIPGVARSERAYVTYLNQLRANVFDSMWEKLPETVQTQQNAERVAKWVNAATGRGTIPQAIEAYTPLANAVMFSPRFFVSRFESNATGLKALADVAKGVTTREALDPLSKQIANDYVKFIGSTGAILGLAALAGAEVESDPRSSDAGKIKMANTRYDLWAGNQPIIRYATQLATSERKDQAGNITEYPRSRVALNFVRSKLAPAAGLIWDMLAGGRTPGGTDLTDTSQENVRKVLMDQFAPMVLNDIAEAMQNNEYGTAGAALGVPSVVGVGVNTFEPNTGGASRQTRPSRPTRPQRPSRSSR